MLKLLYSFSIIPSIAATVFTFIFLITVIYQLLTKYDISLLLAIVPTFFIFLLLIYNLIKNRTIFLALEFLFIFFILSFGEYAYSLFLSFNEKNSVYNISEIQLRSIYDTYLYFKSSTIKNEFILLAEHTKEDIVSYLFLLFLFLLRVFLVKTTLNK